MAPSWVYGVVVTKFNFQVVFPKRDKLFKGAKVERLQLLIIILVALPWSYELVLLAVLISTVLHPCSLFCQILLHFECKESKINGASEPLSIFIKLDF